MEFRTEQSRRYREFRNPGTEQSRDKIKGVYDERE